MRDGDVEGHDDPPDDAVVEVDDLEEVTARGASPADTERADQAQEESDDSSRTPAEAAFEAFPLGAPPT